MAEEGNWFYHRVTWTSHNLNANCLEEQLNIPKKCPSKCFEVQMQSLLHRNKIFSKETLENLCNHTINSQKKKKTHKKPHTSSVFKLVSSSTSSANFGKAALLPNEIQIC